MEPGNFTVETENQHLLGTEKICTFYYILKHDCPVDSSYIIYSVQAQVDTELYNRCPCLINTHTDQYLYHIVTVNNIECVVTTQSLYIDHKL